MSITGISIHHPAMNQSAINANPGSKLVDLIRSWHINGQGWRDIGYHYIINNDGKGNFKAYPGRPENWVGAHTYKNNTGIIGISVAYGLNTAPPQAQLQALAELIADICKRHNIAINRKNIKGHREFPYNAGNECPGQNLFDRLDEVVKMAQNIANPKNQNTAVAKPAPEKEDEPLNEIDVRYGSSGASKALLIQDSTYIPVSLLKRMLNDFGFPLDFDYVEAKDGKPHYVSIQRRTALPTPTLPAVKPAPKAQQTKEE